MVTVGGRQLEVCAWQLDLSLTWGIVDLAAPAWPTAERHAWRPAVDPAATALVGRVVTALDVVENSYRVERRQTGAVVEGWLLSGLRIVTGEVALTVYNALDQNGLTSADLEGTRLRPLR